ncbi:MAG: hypothetical protein WAM91_05135, partial [Candidatus Acidiferrales bacterium]
MQYDPENRVAQVSYNAGNTGVTPSSTVVNHYDAGGAGAYAIGRLTSMDDALGSGSQTYTYDPMGRVTQAQKIVDGQTYTTSYSPNTAGELISMTYPSRRVVQMGYDVIGRLCAVAIAASNGGCASVTSPYSSNFAYNAAQQTTQFTYGNGVAANFTYSPTRSQLTSLSYANSTGTQLFSLGYGYTQGQGNNGNITNITDYMDSGRTVSYTYDPLSRLTSAVTVGIGNVRHPTPELSSVVLYGSANYLQWGLSWTYDRYGNRWAQDITAGCLGWDCPSPSHTVSSATNQFIDTGLSYDANGNMLNDGYNTMVYDAANRLLSTTNGASGGSYVYDGGGDRVEKTS